MVAKEIANEANLARKMGQYGKLMIFKQGKNCIKNLI